MAASKTTSLVQVPPEEVLNSIVSIENDQFEISIPPSLSYGKVAHGGFVVAAIHRTAVKFTSQQLQNDKHSMLQRIAVSFFRPIFTSPQKATIKFSIASANKAWTTLHVEVVQQKKTCIAGYLTLAPSAGPTKLTFQTGWNLAPALMNSLDSLRDLGTDNNPNWVSYKTPFDGTSFRLAEAYFRYYLPVHRPHEHITDQWVTPAWEGPAGSEPKWTDELIHCLLDNGVPALLDIISHRTKHPDTFYASVVRAGLAQQEARSQGKSDAIWGQGLRDVQMAPYFYTTQAITTEVKKLLPKEGTKWLFLRITAKAIVQGRADHEATLMDENGDIVALSNLALQVVPIGKKEAKPKSKI